MREGQIIGRVNRGAGVYGIPAPTHVTTCVNSRNPHGHNKECPCGWWAREHSPVDTGGEVIEFPKSKYDWGDPEAA